MKLSSSGDGPNPQNISKDSVMIERMHEFFGKDFKASFLHADRFERISIEKINGDRLEITAKAFIEANEGVPTIKGRIAFDYIIK